MDVGFVPTATRGFVMSATPMTKWQMKFQLAHEGVYDHHGALRVAGERPQASKRFETTTKSATEYVKSKLHEVPNREEVSQDLRRRKLNNTRTNIDMGSERQWVTEAMYRQRDTTSGGASLPDLARNKAFKKHLTQVSNIAMRLGISVCVINTHSNA